MSRRDAERLRDIVAAAEAIASQLTRGELSNGLIYAAARVRLIESGEAVAAVSEDVLTTEPRIPWRAGGLALGPARNSALGAIRTRDTRFGRPWLSATRRCPRSQTAWSWGPSKHGEASSFTMSRGTVPAATDSPGRRRLRMADGRHR